MYPNDTYAYVPKAVQIIFPFKKYVYCPQQLNNIQLNQRLIGGTRSINVSDSRKLIKFWPIKLFVLKIT